MRNKDTILLEQAYNKIFNRHILLEDTKEDALKALQNAIAAHAANTNNSTEKALEAAWAAYYKAIATDVKAAGSNPTANSGDNDNEGWKLDSVSRQVVGQPQIQTTGGVNQAPSSTTTTDEDGSTTTAKQIVGQPSVQTVAAGDESFAGYTPTAARPTETGEEVSPTQRAANSANTT
jgi:hypothetical protein